MPDAFIHTRSAAMEDTKYDDIESTPTHKAKRYLCFYYNFYIYCNNKYFCRSINTMNRKSSILEGNRIVNIRHFFEEIVSFNHCGLFSCTPKELKIVNETRKGFVSKVLIKCQMCHEKKVISTSPDDGKLNANQASALATISIGCGYSQLAEFSSTFDIPPIGYKLFKKEEKNLQQVMQEEIWKIMREAGAEEARIARENGDVDQNGVPQITVIADGAWCKRSYRSAYNAHSGAACIVGQKTGKILYLGIRNKFCVMCQVNNSKHHTCFKNWTGSSTSMESDIILEGFKRSIQMHGIKYAYLVGDGDSSVFKKLQVEKPYGNFAIQKVECSNHLLRNYCNNLKQLITKKFSSKGFPISSNLKTSLKNNIQRLRIAIDCAVKYRREQNVSFQQQVLNLRKDIENSISHVFGDHSRCDKYFCKGEKPNELNLIDSMKECGLYNDIFSQANRLIYNSRSLIKNMTNNNAECFNNVIAKFISGKRIDFSKKGGYSLRCQAAGISFNKGADYYNVIHNALTGNSPRQAMKKYIGRKKQIAALVACKRKLCQQKNQKYKTYKKKIDSQEIDEDYGDVEDLIDDEEWTRRKNEFLSELKKNKMEIQLIMESTKEQRESTVWVEERRKRITASIFGKICKLRSTTDPKKTAKTMLRSFTAISTSYGIEHEPIAVKEFSTFLGIEIQPCGFFIDENDFYLGATPDGLVGHNGLVEIKCPYSCRQLSPIEAIQEKKLTYMEVGQEGSFNLKKNHNYYFQVQAQLHISKRDFCYFVVWTPKGFIHDRIERDDEFFEAMKEKLKNFYFEHYLPEILRIEHKIIRV